MAKTGEQFIHSKDTEKSIPLEPKNKMTEKDKKDTPSVLDLYNFEEIKKSVSTQEKKGEKI